jgi:hypothetical protein
MQSSRSSSPTTPRFGISLFNLELPADIYTDLLASEFKVTGQPQTAAKELYDSLTNERTRIFEFLDDNAIVRLANSPAGLDHTLLQQIRGVESENPLHALIKLQSLRNFINQYSSNDRFKPRLRYLTKMREHREEAAAIKAKFVDVILASDAIAFDKPYHLDELIPAVINCNAVSSFTLMIKRQLALLGDSNSFWEQALEMVLEAEQPDLVIALMSCGMSPNILLTLDYNSPEKPLLCTLLEDYTTAIVSLSPPPYETSRADDSDITIFSTEIAIYLKEKSAGLMKLIHAMLERNVNLEDENINRTAQHVIDTLGDYAHLREEHAAPYRWVIEKFNYHQSLVIKI